MCWFSLVCGSFRLVSVVGICWLVWLVINMNGEWFWVGCIVNGVGFDGFSSVVVCSGGINVLVMWGIV